MAAILQCAVRAVCLLMLASVPGGWSCDLRAGAYRQHGAPMPAACTFVSPLPAVSLLMGLAALWSLCGAQRDYDGCNRKGTHTYRHYIALAHAGRARAGFVWEAHGGYVACAPVRLPSLPQRRWILHGACAVVWRGSPVWPAAPSTYVRVARQRSPMRSLLLVIPL